METDILSLWAKKNQLFWKILCMNVNAFCRNWESLQTRGSLCWQVLWSRDTVWISCMNSPRSTGGSCTSLRTSQTVCQGWRSTRTRWVACPAQFYWKPRNWGSVMNRSPSRWKGTCSLHGHDIFAWKILEVDYFEILPTLYILLLLHGLNTANRW